jgi:hypothetical protein
MWVIVGGVTVRVKSFVGNKMCYITCVGKRKMGVAKLGEWACMSMV